ncbi:hypothetical protein SPFM9_00041 [Salmonella phage SPFM9]|nr:hypothetical protein SPFM9_00041 [Salmonella phage SPFM9]
MDTLLIFLFKGVEGGVDPSKDDDNCTGGACADVNMSPDDEMVIPGLDPDAMAGELGRGQATTFMYRDGLGLVDVVTPDVVIHLIN